jgi:pyrimidine operon attenuation protein/uracil phosphoribosyltransferase
MTASEVDRTPVLVAYQMVEENGVEGLGLIGIRRGGVPPARWFAPYLQKKRSP